MLIVRRSDANSINVGQSLERENTLDGCEELTISCFGNPGNTALIVSYFNSSGSDVGATFGSTSISTTLRCNDNSRWMITGNFSSAVLKLRKLNVYLLKYLYILIK
uniref:Uncharacterized protein n=1 Tax=Meloidogyne enterolobii TaxID=390850 RepID=A0A6V7VAM6_MELEN|nr:unnamed protein product [Meloidogyne enterolobii]